MAPTPPKSDWIWKDGEFVRWEDANVHLLAHAVQFGTSLFEGIRCYETPEGPAVFRLDAHMRRLVDSCTVYRMAPQWSADELAQASEESRRIYHAARSLPAGYREPVLLRLWHAIGAQPGGGG